MIGVGREGCENWHDFSANVFHSLPILAKMPKMSNKWFELKVSQKDVDIFRVLLCGQSLRWKKIRLQLSRDGIIGVFGHRLWLLKQNEGAILYQSFGKGEESSPDHQTLNTLLHNYFRLEVSLSQLYQQWTEKDERFKVLTERDYQGIRILAQDPVENIFSFICSSNNNSQMMEKLCIYFGEKITSYEGVDYFDFPQVERLVGSKVEKKLREEKFGYRARYIVKSAEKIVEKGGDEWINGLKKLDYAAARAELQTLTGVGRKVADCIALMSLGFDSSIPVDIHIHQIAKYYLPHLSKCKTLTDSVYLEITDYFRSIHGEYAGWAQLLLFTSNTSQTDEVAKEEDADVQNKSGSSGWSNPSELICANASKRKSEATPTNEGKKKKRKRSKKKKGSQNILNIATRIKEGKKKKRNRKKKRSQNCQNISNLFTN